MSLERITDKVVEADVLVVGGGIAGCPAAVKAKEHGLNVVLVEKAKLERSGSAGAGIDHFDGLFPRDGLTPLDLARRHNRSPQDMNLKYKLIKQAFWVLDELERLGVTMRWDNGQYYWLPYATLGLPLARVSLRVHWQNVKSELARAVRKSGVNVLDRTMIVDLLTNKGTVTGATAINTRTGEFIIIKARSTVIADGYFHRSYDPEQAQPGKYKMRYHMCPSAGSGDGWAAAYRAGAELANLDIQRWGRIRDDLTIPVGNFRLNEGIPFKCFTSNGEEIITPGAFPLLELEQKGDTPIYNSLEHLPDDYHKRMEIAFADERAISLKIAEDRGFNPRTHRYEVNFKPIGFMHQQGIKVDEDSKASLKGLYAAGGCVAGIGSVSFSSSNGLLVGDTIGAYVNEVAEPIVDEGQVESQKRTALAPLSVKDGTEPMEFELTIRYISERYNSTYKSGGELQEGLRRLGSIKREFLPKLMANSPHYLMRALECRNIMELAELNFQATLERKETRRVSGFVRFDYPEEDPALENKSIFQRMEDGKAVLELREWPKWKEEEYAKEES